MGFRSIYLSAIYLILSIAASAQYYETGQDPSNLKWLQTKTDRFTVIYPEKYGSQGIEFARALDKAYSDLLLLFPDRKFRIPVIIHNYTVSSNGYVAWAPRRMEIYPSPEQNSIPLDQYRQLALHELTHVMQMESLNTGFTKALSFAFGEQFTGAVASLLPLWYMEGDAVFAETVLSGSGRGKAASFQKELKALAIEKEHIYKFDKMLNASFRNYTPDHYHYGYQMVAWSLAKNDPKLWNKTLKLTASQPFTLNPVNISLNRNANLTKYKLFKQTFDSLTTLWKEDIARAKSVSYEQLNPSGKRDYVNYFSPQYVGRDSVIAIKTSFSGAPAFVLIRPSEKSEKRLFSPGRVYPYFFSSGGGNIVWVETHGDPRWENREYSVIKIKKIKSGKVRQLTFKSRYMAASISPDGRLIAAAENSINNQNSLVIINPSDGKRLEEIPSPGNAPLQRPQWSDDGSLITVIYLTEAGEGIMSYNIATKTWEIMVEAEKYDLQSAFLRNDSLFYVSSATGTENIFLLSPWNKSIPVTRSRFGATDINLSGTSIFFSDYSSSGNNICKISLSDIQDEQYVPVKPVSYLADRFDYNSGSKPDENVSFYSTQRYKKWQHLLGVHSWMPIYADIEAIQSDPSSIRPGITIMSQNQLSTLVASASYEYSADRRNILHSRVTWSGWYPVFESRIDYGYPPVIDLLGETVSWGPSDPNLLKRISNTISIPLSFSPGQFSQTLYPSFSIDYLNRYLYLKENNSYDYGQFHMTGRLYFSNYSRYAYRDIYPKLAQVFDLSYTFAPYDKLVYGSDLYLKTAFFFPGIFRNNGIRFRFETEKQNFTKYLTSNKIHFPRSYFNIISGKLDFFSIDYQAPLAYPDFNLLSLLYLKRIRSGFFFDYARGSDNYYLGLLDGSLGVNSHTTGPNFFSSYGVELLSDFYLFRIPYMISGGFQAAWKEFGKTPTFEVLFNIDIYGMSIGRRKM